MTFFLIWSPAGETDPVHHRAPQRSQKGNCGEPLPVRERPCEPLMVNRVVVPEPLRPVLRMDTCVVCLAIAGLIPPCHRYQVTSKCVAAERCSGLARVWGVRGEVYSVAVVVKPPGSRIQSAGTESVHAELVSQARECWPSVGRASDCQRLWDNLCSRSSCRQSRRCVQPQAQGKLRFNS